MPVIPVNEFGWSSVSSVYNNKRKHQDDDENMDMEESFGTLNKRHCQQQHVLPESQHPHHHLQHFQHPQHPQHPQHVQTQEVNHNTVILPNYNQNNNNQTDVLQQDLHGCLKDVAAVPKSQFLLTNTPESQSLASSQNDMIMDLCDETYSTAALGTTDSCSSLDNMDNDCVPDSQQYKLYDYSCDGISSPGRIRGYCKPTWDHLLDLRPYVSDYY